MSRRTVLTTATEAPTMTEPLEPFTQEDQSDGVKKERFVKPTTQRKEKGRKKVAKSPKKKRAFQPSDIIKGQRGIPMKKNTTLRSLVRGVWWGRKPLLELLNKRLHLVNGQFLNKRTTLLSLVRSMPMAKKPLVDVIVNKML